MANELCLVQYKPIQIDLPLIFASSVRRYFAEHFPHDCFHNHAPDGGSKYRGAPVQFKVINQELYLLGVGEGAPFLGSFQWPELIQIPIGRSSLLVDFRFNSQRAIEAIFSECDQQIYRSLSPYLALNQEAYRTFIGASDLDRRAFVEKGLSDHILTAAKWCGVWVNHRIRTSLIQMRLQPSIRVKDNLTFVGMDVVFESNTKIPDFIGIGRFVSRGYGTVVQYG